MYNYCMPGKNLEKIYGSECYYHLYNRGVNKNTVFVDQEDYGVFLNLLKRYLSNSPVIDKKGRDYPWYGARLELLAFCLMPNHYHLLIFQSDPKAMTELIKSLGTSYGMYFNKKYKRVGPVFQSRFRASMIDSQQYLDHISRYIHLNPGKTRYKNWEPSSYNYYLKNKTAEWVKPKRILDMFNGKVQEYSEFVADYEDYKEELDLLKHELANN